MSSFKCYCLFVVLSFQSDTDDNLERLRHALGEENNLRKRPPIVPEKDTQEILAMSDRDLLVHNATSLTILHYKVDNFIQEQRYANDLVGLGMLATVERLTQVEAAMSIEERGRASEHVAHQVKAFILRNTNSALRMLKLDSNQEIITFMRSEKRVKAATNYILSTVPYNSYFPRQVVTRMVTENYQKMAAWRGPTAKYATSCTHLVNFYSHSIIIGSGRKLRCPRCSRGSA